MEISQAEKLKTIELARQMMQNMMEQYFPAAEMKQYRENLDKLYGRRAQPQPAETPEETAKFEAALADARNRRGH